MSTSSFTYSVFSLFYFTWGIYLFFWLPILEHLGFSLTSAGQLISMGWIARGLGAYFVFSPLVNRLGTVYVGRIFFLGLTVLVGAIMLPFSLTVKAGLSILISTVLSLGFPLIETIGSESKRQYGTDYELARILGVSSFILCVLMASGLNSWFGLAGSLWFLQLICVALVVVFFIGDRDRASIVKKVGKLPRLFYIYLGISSCLQGAHAVYYAYGVKTFLSYGFSNTFASLLIAMGVMAEGIFYFACRGSKYLSVFRFMVIGAIFGIARWVLYANFSSDWMLFFASLLHGLSFGAAHLGFVYYVNQRLPRTQWAKAFGLYTAVTMSFSLGLATALAAPVYEFSISLSFGLMAALSFVGLLGCYWARLD